MNKCDKQLYNSGSYWFRRLVDRYKNYNIYFKKHSSYKFVQVYYKTPMYHLHLLSIPLQLTEINYNEAIFRDSLENKSIYEETKSKNRLDEVKSSSDLVRGYWASIHKIDKRFYLLRNNGEYLSNSLQMAKNRKY